QRGLARARDFSLELFNAGWATIVDEATAWLGERPYRRLMPAAPGRGRASQGRVSDEYDLPLADEIDLLAQTAGDIIRPYVVRSNAPVVGPLIAWTRRNLTSHLREPYLDPTLRRQEGFNWLVVQTLRQINRLLNHAQPAADDL